MAEYCTLGGKVPEKAWVPLGGKDYSSVIAKIPKDVDALLVVLGGADAVNFLTQYENSGGDKPMLGGSITVSQDILNYKGKRRDSLRRNDLRRPGGRSYRRRRVEGFRRRLPEDLPRVGRRFPEPEPVRLRVLREHEGDARWRLTP